jgi:hypothetical protein
MKDAYITSLFVLFLADVSVMGYIYRAYFGRSLVNEHPVLDNTKEWVYDETTHTYNKAKENKIYI